MICCSLPGRDRCSFEEVFLDRALVAVVRLLAIELLRDLVSVIEDLLDGSRQCHCSRNSGVAGMA